jgi:hypothetical protein
MTISSITRQGAFEPFELQVARATRSMGHSSVVNVFGYNADVDTDAGDGVAARWRA